MTATLESLGARRLDGISVAELAEYRQLLWQSLRTRHREGRAQARKNAARRGEQSHSMHGDELPALPPDGFYNPAAPQEGRAVEIIPPPSERKRGFSLHRLYENARAGR